MLILVVGCIEECPPQQTCPTVTCPSLETLDNNLYVYFIDVKHSDATLIKYKDTEMLIDCGSNIQGPDVVEFLKEKKVTNLEYLLITNLDEDNIGGCDDVLRHFHTNTVITNGDNDDSSMYKEFKNEIDTEQLLVGSIGNSFNIGPSTLDIIQSNNGLSFQENSLVTKLIFNNISILFTGDCIEECEDLLLGKDINSTILKPAHHGTKLATDIDFLEKVNPDVAIISTGIDNNYGHPAYGTLDKLSQEGVIIYRTDYDGDVTVRMDGSSYEVLT